MSLPKTTILSVRLRITDLHRFATWRTRNTAKRVSRVSKLSRPRFCGDPRDIVLPAPIDPYPVLQEVYAELGIERYAP
jgi:hypothetical protein